VPTRQSTLRRYVSNLSSSRHIGFKTGGFKFLESNNDAHYVDKNRNQLLNFESHAFCELEKHHRTIKMCFLPERVRETLTALCRKSLLSGDRWVCF